MEHKPVSSSNIVSVAHDPSKNELEVRFKNGGLYKYTGVTSVEHSQLVNAASIGGHLHKHIKSKYPGVRLAE